MTNDALEFGGFDESFRYVEDVDFGWRFQQVGKTVGIAAAVVHYRARTDTRESSFGSAAGVGTISSSVRAIASTSLRS